MAGKHLILDFGAYDLSRVVDDQTGIRRVNPQRFEMEQLTAICYEDTERHVAVGYKDVREDEFWVRGHMPGAPLMPGVVMLEAAAQLCSYHTIKHNLLGSTAVGLGGVESIRFRGPVRPGDRLVVVAELTRVRPGALVTCRFQEFVEQELVCEGTIKGFPLDRALE